ncbi:MAG: FtsH protease activity modulator HflK [Bryobacteraceae bacterium]
MSTLLVEPATLEQQPRIAEPVPSVPARRRRRISEIILLLWVASGVYLVRPDQQAVVTRFGGVVDSRVYPGIHYALPWPVDRVFKVKVHQSRRLSIGGDVADAVLGRAQPLASQFLTGDKNIINMRVVVQYSVAVPVEYLFSALDVAKCVSVAVEAELARRMARSTVDAVLTTAKVAIQDEALSSAQTRLNQYRIGVKLSTVNIESVTPPPEAADAFRDVASAHADTARIIDEARGYANDLVPRARGEAKQMTEAALAYRASKVNEASGEAARFAAVAAEYSKAAQVTATRLYIEAMEQILPKIRKMIIDPNGNLDLSIIRRGEPAPKP